MPIRYAMNLKQPGMLSGYEFKYNFSTLQNPKSFLIPWSLFETYYRGKLIPNATFIFDTFKPLTSLSIMCASYFNQQSGDFSLTLKEIALYRQGASF